ncbi:glycoside hydrolase/deacetylase [Anaeromyces robustus]|uniref:Glycoside hydrolase/deacetylase n=1 Tax=Anaeromyces robustus TaxID=1754192 RepID=A0A1Y1XF45_9FUNG|nr:glycoside hydrolase/deacetylase [Anaeromyces robustus]|eukprot:ORX84390.1 glycoside hydrolase/deacetylase [Anaeromyces robustus]
MKITTILKGFLFGAGLVSSAKIYSCTEKNTIALTFDDGPFEYTEELLDVLKKKNIKATFFINAENYWKDFPTNKERQETLKKQYEAGHQIASHTWYHEIPSSNSEIKSMMTKFDDLIEEIIGERPKYFRAPQGNCDEDCISYFEELGYKVIQWDTDTNDWRKSDDRVKLVKEYLTDEWKKEKDNYLILMHDVQKHTVKEIVPWIIENAPFDKYKFVTVAECLGNKNDMYVSGKTVDDSSNNTNSTDKNIIENDDIQYTIPNVNNTDSSNLLNSGAPSSFGNVFYTIVIAFILLFISYNIMTQN